MNLEDHEEECEDEHYLIDSKTFDSSIMTGNTKIYRMVGKVHALKVMFQFRIRNIEGEMLGDSGDYLVRNFNGELYIVDSEIFDETFEEVEP